MSERGSGVRCCGGNGLGRRVDAEAEVIAEDGEESEPVLGGGIAGLGGFDVSRADVEEQFVVSVLGFPEVEIEWGGADDTGDFGGGGEVDEIGGIGCEPRHAAFEIPFGDIGEALPIELDVAAPAFFEELTEASGVGVVGFELPAEIGIEDEGRGGLERWREWSAEIFEETEERGIGIGDLTESAFDILMGGGEDLVEDFALFVAEEVFEGIEGLAEVTVHEADDLWKIGAFEGVAHFLGELLIGVGALIDADAAIDVVIAEVQDAEAKDIGVAGDFEGDPGAADEEAIFAGGELLAIFALAGEGIDAGAFGVIFEEGTDGVVGADFFAVDDGWADELFVDTEAVAVFGDIAASLSEELEELGFEIKVKEIASELEGAAGVLDDLDGFDAGEFVEEPAATGVHEHGVALEFEEADGGDPVILGQGLTGVALEESFEVIGGAVEDDGDVIVTSGPGIAEEVGAMGLEVGCELIAEPVEGFAEGAAPVLIPGGMAAGVAGAVGAPAIDAVGAAPGAGLVDIDFEGWGMRSEELAVIGEAGEVIGFDVTEGVGESHFAVAMVMAVGFAIGGDMDELIVWAVMDEGVGEAMGEAFAAGE
jgi:hypothetical protein